MLKHGVVREGFAQVEYYHHEGSYASQAVENLISGFSGLVIHFLFS